jgi:AraC-like DNA-binding protein
MAFFMPDSFLKRLLNENKTNLPLSVMTEAAIDHLLPLDVNEVSRSFFFSMLPYFTQVPQPPENLLELKFKELILSLLSNKKNVRLLSYLNNLSMQDSPSIEDIMQNNFTFNLTINDYAKLACKSVPTFNREFKRIFNTSPARWIAKRRLAMATELLENSSQPIAEISYECGFQNQGHFSRVFKDKMGISPLQFRMNTSAVPGV